MPDIDVTEAITTADSATVSVVNPNKPLQRKTALGSNKVRIQNKNTEQTVIAAASVLHKITITGNGAAAVVTVSDGVSATAANILTILEVVADKSKTFIFGCNMDNGIYITPAATTDDITVSYN